MKEVENHRTKCYDEEETSDIKARRIAERHMSPWTRLCAGRRMMKNKAHGQDYRFGDRDFAGVAHEDRVRDHALVR